MVLEICNESLTPLKVDFLQQHSQSANLFDNKAEILNVAANPIFHALHNVWKASKKDYLKTDLLFVV